MAVIQRRTSQAPSRWPAPGQTVDPAVAAMKDANPQWVDRVFPYVRVILLGVQLGLGFVAPYLLLTGTPALGGACALMFVTTLSVDLLMAHSWQRWAVRQRDDALRMHAQRSGFLRTSAAFSCVGIVGGILLGIAMQGQAVMAATPSATIGRTAISDSGLAYSPDGTALALRTPHGIAIANRADGAITQQLSIPTVDFVAGQSSIAVAWNTTRLAAAYRVGTGDDTAFAVTAWNVTSGAVQFTAALDGPVSSLVWSPDDATLAGYLPPQSHGDFGTILLWDAVTGASKTPIFTTNSLTPTSHDALFSWSPDPTRLAIVNDSHTVLVLDLRFTDSVERFTATQDITTLSWSPDGVLLAIGHDDGSVSLLDMHTLTVRHTLMTQPRAVLHLTWSPDSRHLLAADDAEIAVIDMTTARVVTRLERQSGQHAQSVPIAVGQDVRPLTDFAPSAAATIVGVTWTVDGAFIGARYSDGTLVSWSAHAIGG